MPDFQIVVDLWILFVPLALHGLGLLFVADVIMNGRTSQGTIAWVMALLFFPYLAVFLYLIFGARRLKEYADARRSGDTPIIRLGQELLQNRQLLSLMADRTDANLDSLNVIARMPIMTGNRCSLLINGKATFDSILDGIASARNYVLVQFFRVRDDKLGRKLRDLCIRKAQAGIRVYFLYDRAGSAGLPNAYTDALQAAGVQVKMFRVGKGLLNRFRVNFRNHRKIVVVDGEKSWMGGHNVGDEYLGKSKRLNPWRDTHVKVEGPVSLAVQLSFAEDWHWASGKLPDISWEPPASFGNQLTLCIPTGPGDLMETGSLLIVQAINMSKKRCWILTPYFVPDVAVIKALQLAAIRGVDVRILIPGLPDKRVVWWAAHSYVFEVAVAGVRIFTYQNGFMHQKVFLIDNSFAGIGTANLDNRSLRINFEISMIFTDPDFIKKVDRMCRDDFAYSKSLTPKDIQNRNLPFRLAIRAARLLSPIL